MGCWAHSAYQSLRSIREDGVVGDRVTAPTRPSPYDTAISEMEGKINDPHVRYAVHMLRSRRQGWLVCEDKLLPIIKQLLELLNHDSDWCASLESRITDTGIALIKQAEEVVDVT